MTPFRAALLALAAVALLVVGVRLSGDAVAQTANEPVSESAPAPAEPRSVVVELFTSQGCSSCPPADRLLSELRESGEAAGVEIVPLSFHVDYWNYIGWTDPFSSAAWSHRQRRYAEALDLGTIYTPQTVFDGHLECVGSSRRKVTGLLAEAARQADLDVSLEIDATEGGHRARVSVGPSDHDAELSVLLAVWEDGLVTPVGRGENARKTLENDAVVRSLVRLGSLDRGGGRWEEELRLDEGWDRSNLGIAVLVQDPKTMRIYGSASAGV